MPALNFSYRVKTFNILLISEIVLFEKIVNLTSVACVAARYYRENIEINICGNVSSADEKMIGITPVALTLIGM